MTLCLAPLPSTKSALHFGRFDSDCTARAHEIVQNFSDQMMHDADIGTLGRALVGQEARDEQEARVEHGRYQEWSRFLRGEDYAA